MVGIWNWNKIQMHSHQYNRQAWGKVHVKVLKYSTSTLTFGEVQVQVHGIVLGEVLK